MRTISQNDPLCYSIFIRAAGRVAQKYGLTSEVLLAGTGLSPEVLSDPYQQISHSQELLFYRNFVRAADIPWLGLEVGSKSSLSILGTVGHVRLAARDARDVTDIARQNYSLMNLHLLYDESVKAGEVVHSVTEEEPLGDLRRFMIERVFALIQCHADELIGPECKPNVVRFDFPDPGYRERYQAIFQCPLEFNQAVNELRYSTQFLDQPIATHDPKVKDVLEILCDNLAQKLDGDHDIVTNVRLAISKKAGRFPSIEDVAASLGVASRTLRRQLRDQGGSYQALLTDARREVAEDYLRNSTLKIQKIAELCGFSDAQNFSQAFKRWTSQSPTEFRKRPRTLGGWAEVLFCSGTRVSRSCTRISLVKSAWIFAVDFAGMKSSAPIST